VIGSPFQNIVHLLKRSKKSTSVGQLGDSLGAMENMMGGLDTSQSSASNKIAEITVLSK